MNRITFTRVPFMLVAALMLLSALWAGLSRIGWDLPQLLPSLSASHGALMLSGFLGTLISLERAVAFSALPNPTPLMQRFGYVAPALTGLGSLTLLAELPVLLGRGLIVLGSLCLVSLFVIVLRRQREWSQITLTLGASLWLSGNALWWLAVPIHRVVPWWIGFLVLTIAAERLELARVMFLRRNARALFFGSVSLLVVGLFISLFNFVWGVRISGVGWFAIGAWLGRYDLARRNIRLKGLTRFIAACLLPGYGWLLVTGALWLLWPEQFIAGLHYDAMLHAVLLGFVFSMIFGHAPIIIPAILHIAIPYRATFYAPLVVLHGSLLVRVAGDLAISPTLRMWGGLLNVAAILLFMGITLNAVRVGAQNIATTNE